jgi:hypothetical protein
MDEPSFTVTVLSRADSTSTFPDGIKVIKSDYTHDSLVSALKGQDAVISAVASTALMKQIDIINAAIEAGVKRYVPGEYGSDTTIAKALQRVPVFGAKIAVVDHLKKNEDKISWTGLITGPFFDWGMKIGFIGFDLKKQTATLYNPGHDQRWSSSTLSDIGTATVQALLPANSALTKNKYVRIRSMTTTQDEILAAVEKVSGKKWETTKVDIDPLVADANEKVKNHDYSGIGIMIVGALLDPECLMDYDKRGVVMNEQLGLPTRNVEELVKELL